MTDILLTPKQRLAKAKILKGDSLKFTTLAKELNIPAQTLRYWATKSKHELVTWTLNGVKHLTVEKNFLDLIERYKPISEESRERMAQAKTNGDAADEDMEDDAASNDQEPNDQDSVEEEEHIPDDPAGRALYHFNRLELDEQKAFAKILFIRFNRDKEEGETVEEPEVESIPPYSPFIRVNPSDPHFTSAVLRLWGETALNLASALEEKESELEQIKSILHRSDEE